MRPALGLAVLVLLLTPAAASGYTQQQLGQWQTVADQQWAGSACSGRLNARVLPTLSGMPGASATTVGLAAINDAETCTYWLQSGLDPYEACVIVVHEAGHLSGLDHQAGTLMDPEPVSVFPWPDYKPCARTIPPVLTQSAALEWVQARWQQLLTLDCRREQLISRMRCWGRGLRGQRLRWTVWIDGEYRVHGGRWS